MSGNGFDLGGQAAQLVLGDRLSAARHAAVHLVLRQAHDAADARLLLDVLGLTADARDLHAQRPTQRTTRRTR